MCCDSYSNTMKNPRLADAAKAAFEEQRRADAYHRHWVDVEELKKRRDNIAQMLNSKAEMRDELSRAVLSLQRSLSNIEEEIKAQSPVFNTGAADTIMEVFGFKRVEEISEELGDMADEL